MEKGGENMIYKWKKKIYPIEAQEVGEYLENLENRDGKLEPETIVNEARDNNALLHKCFEWNDAVAGKKYRENQARHIIQNVVTVHVNPLYDALSNNEIREVKIKQPIETRSFVSVKNEHEKRQYVSINTALNNEYMKNDLLESAKKDMKSFDDKYSHLAELAGVVKEIRKII